MSGGSLCNTGFKSLQFNECSFDKQEINCLFVLARGGLHWGRSQRKNYWKILI